MKPVFRLIDTHCHLNFQAFRGRETTVITRAQQAGVEQIVVVGSTLATSRRAVELAQTHPGVWAVVGLHPHHVFGQREVDIAPFAELATHPKVIGIGETGLDRHQYQHTRHPNYQVTVDLLAAQKRWFVAQLSLAQKLHKSVVIHNREAAEEVLAVLRAEWHEAWRHRLVLHCCEAKPALLQFALERQVFIGVDADVVTDFSKRDFIRQVPLELLVLETDAPYFPLPGLGASVPADLTAIAQAVAESLAVPVSRVAEQTYRNALTLFAGITPS